MYLPLILRPNRAAIKKILLCLLTFSSYFIAISAYIHSQSLFLEKIGLEKLPFVMVVGVVLIIVYSLISSTIGAKFSAPLRLAVFVMLMAVCYLLIYFLPHDDFLQILLFFVVTNFLYDVMDISIVNVSSVLVSPLESKSMLPLLNGCNSLGVIAGCFFAMEIQGFSESIGIGLMPGLSLLLVVLLAGAIVKIFRKELASHTESVVAEGVGYRQQLSETFRFVFNQSRLFRTLGIVVFLLVVIRVFADFKFKTNMSMGFQGEDFTDLFGKIYMLESALTFIIDFLLTKWLLFRFGVIRMILIYPLMLLLSLLALMASGYHVSYVVIFALVASVPWYSIVSVAIAQIFSIAPREKAQQIYFFVVGMLSSLTKLAASLFLLIYAANISLEQNLNSGLIILFSILMLVAVLKLWKDYQAELKIALFRDNVFLRHQAIELLAEKTQKNAGEIYLRRLLNLRNTDEESKLKTINSLGVIGNYQTVNDFIKVLKGGNPQEMFAALQAIGTIVRSRKNFEIYPITKHLLFKTYREIFISNVPHYIKLEIISALKHFNLEEVIDFLERNLQSDDSQVKINVIETLASFDDRAVIQYLEPLLGHADIRVVVAAVAALWKFDDMRIYLLPKLVIAMSGKTTENMESSLFLIGAIRAYWEKDYVVRLCESDVAHIRRSAFITMIYLGERQYLDNLLNEFVVLSRKLLASSSGQHSENHEVEFILSQYRKFGPENKEMFIVKIQQLPTADVQAVYECFRRSRYVFTKELDDLTC